MNKKQRAQIVMEHLEKLYPETPIPLNHKDHYTLLIAVMLSAQSTDKKVNEITPELFKIADNPEEMSRISVEKIRSIIKPIGLSPTKAKNISLTSKKLIKEFNGRVPKEFKKLESLPGVGHKTAAVVMSQGFGIPAFPVDTHIHRLAQRWKLSSGKNVTQTEKDLKKLFPREKWNKLHLQIIFYGREYCPARNHKEEDCLICKHTNQKY